MRLLHAWMAGVVVHVDMIDLLPGGGEIVVFLVRLDVLQRDHVDRADELAAAVVGEVGAVRQGIGIVIMVSQTRLEFGQRHERHARFAFVYERRILSTTPAYSSSCTGALP